MGNIFSRSTFECTVCLYTYRFDKDELLQGGHAAYVNAVKYKKLRECHYCYQLTPAEKIERHARSYHELVIKPSQPQPPRPDQLGYYIPTMPL